MSLTSAGGGSRLLVSGLHDVAKFDEADLITLPLASMRALYTA